MTCTSPTTQSDHLDPKSEASTTPMDIAGVERALQRAYENACRIAWQTNTAVVVEENGQLVKIYFSQPPFPPECTP